MRPPRVLLVATNRRAAPEIVPPIALAHLAGALQRAGAQVRALDLFLAGDDPLAAVLHEVDRFRPDLVGLSVRNLDNASALASEWYAPEVAALARGLRARGVPVVIGGSAVSIAPNALMEFADVSLAIAGEGEEALVALAAAVTNGGDPSGVPGVLVRGWDWQPGTIPVTDLADTPPAYDVLDMAEYVRRGALIGVQTKRGCRFVCSYCTYPYIEGRRNRLRSPESVADEVRALRERYGVERVFLVDSVFNDPPEHALAVCRALTERAPGIRYSCYLTPRRIDEELARALVESGCEGAEFGTDSLSTPVLRRLTKPFSVSTVMAVTAVCRDAGLRQCHHLILGSPGETPETLRETLDRAEELPADVVILTIGVRVYPGTPLARALHPELEGAAAAELLRPRYHVADAVADGIEDLVRDRAANNPNWVVPALGINYDERVLERLRSIGLRGPAWLMLIDRRVAPGA